LPRGGARLNSGGKRLGAGRPKTKTAVVLPALLRAEQQGKYIRFKAVQRHCSEGCVTRSKLTLGMCPKHYQRHRASKTISGDAPLCSVSGCLNLSRTKGMCSAHYQRVNKHGALDPRRPCSVCGQMFSRADGLLYCSILCAHEGRKRTYIAKYIRTFQHKQPVQCKSCHVQFSRLPGYRLKGHCSEECLQSFNRRRRSKNNAIRRSKYECDAADDIDPYKVFTLAGWRCYICDEPTPRELRGTYEQRAPELEHIVPLSKGGMHTWDNVACACRACNLSKGARMAWLSNMVRAQAEMEAG
jgi:5-methylcytosine-specific restriction endonuclease McrA